MIGLNSHGTNVSVTSIFARVPVLIFCLGVLNKTRVYL